MVVGAESAIGVALTSELRRARWPVLLTSRRHDAAAGTLPLDMAEALPDLLQRPQVRSLRKQGSLSAFLFAGVTSYQRCADDPLGSRRVNVEGVLGLAEQLTKAGALVVFPSTTAVFGSAAGMPQESAPVAPATEYGRQKAEVESRLLQLNREACAPAGAVVVRLTKVVSARGLVGEWLQRLSGGSAIEAASDLMLSPISARWAARAFMKLASARPGAGPYHVAGDGVCSYFEFACALAKALGADTALVHPAKLRMPAGTAGLTLGSASRDAGLEPQPLDSAIRDLVADAEPHREGR